MRAVTPQPGSRSSQVSRGKADAPIAWRPSQELDIGQWAAAGRRIGTVGRCVQWLLGDWIAYGNLKFGEKYSRAAEITGYDSQSLMNMVYVASRFPISRRRETLSWSHHETIAALDSDNQEHWLDQAVAHSWSVADLRVMLRSTRKSKNGKNERTGDSVAAEVGAAGSHSIAADGGEVVLEAKRLKAGQVGLVKCPRCGEEVAVAS